MSTFWTRLHFSWLWLFIATASPGGFHEVAAYVLGCFFLVAAFANLKESA